MDLRAMTTRNRYFIETFGCQMNVNDSEKVAGLLEAEGYEKTESRESADVNRAYDLGANSYLVKPVGFDALTDLVRILQGYWVGWNEKPEIETA